jgi:uncharacterized protein (DUF342 family)
MSDITNKGIIVPDTVSTAEDVSAPIDSKITVIIDVNYRDASVTVTAPENGGKEVKIEEIIRELESKGIVYGVDNILISRIVNEKLYGSPFVVARASAPVNGEDGTVTYKYEKDYKPKPKIRDDGIADYKELGTVQIITSNTVIAEVTKPTDGVPGRDIRNKEIPQKKGEKANFTLGQNIGITSDGLRIVSNADGVLRWVKDCFLIETTLTVDDVDNSTGNLKFIGDIVVRGDVKEGFKVHSDRNITVHGTVSGATLNASGEIKLKGGCLVSTLKAAGEISASFFESCTISTDGDIISQSFTNCNITCGGSIMTKGAGIIQGGHSVCLGNIQCNVLGSKNFTKTEIIVGNTAVFVKERSELQEFIKELDEELVNLTRDIKYLMERKSSLGHLNQEKQSALDSCMKQRMMKKKLRSEKESRIEEINELLANKKYHEIVCRGKAYPNTVIRIGEATQILTSKCTNCTFLLNEEDNTINIRS